jgi:predicted RNA-binding protein YlxR (DUF448 family)
LLAVIEQSETDEGLAAARKGLERMCVATRAVKPVTEMIRLVAAPDGKVVPDVERKLPGRGVWVTASRAALEQAVRDKAIVRALRGVATVDPVLPDLVEQLLEKSALEGISLANKAGLMLTGTAKVEAALAEGKVALLIHASDAAADGVRKLEAVARAAEEHGFPKISRSRAYRGDQLDLALGRPNVVHAALLAHPAGAGFLGRCLRLERWRTGGTAGSAAAPGPEQQADLE